MQMRGISYDWIRKCREARKMTQQELADKAGISRTYLSNLERGVSANPTLDIVTRLSKAMDFKPEPVNGTIELDSGYQIVCSVTGLKFRQVADWLAEQIGHEFENGDKIAMIESFQVIVHPGRASMGKPYPDPFYDCIAICRVANQEREQ